MSRETSMDEQQTLIARKKDPLRLYIRNLPFNVSTEELTEKFSVFNVQDIELKRGYCFAAFDTPENAKKALDEFTESEIDGRKLYVDQAMEKLTPEQYSKLSSLPKRNLFIKELDESVDNEQLRDYFSAFGEVETANTYLRRDGNKFGFVMFVNIEDAQKAKENASDFNGKEINVEYATPNRRGRGRRARGGFTSRGGRAGFRNQSNSRTFDRKLYVSEISKSTSEKSLEENFSIYGSVEKVEIVRDRETDESKGFGYVTFEKSEDADNALENLKGVTIDDQVIHVEMARKNRGGFGSFRGGGRRRFSGRYGGRRGGNRGGRRNDRDNEDRPKRNNRSQNRRRSQSKDDAESKNNADENESGWQNNDEKATWDVEDEEDAQFDV